MAKKAAAAEESAKTEPAKETCGIIMPISEIDGCSESHWQEVREIIEDVVSEAGYQPSMVSDADDVGLIHKRIVENLYLNPIVVCDVSGKNPNVMFELGMRLAFDMPVIVVKDDKTGYSFDMSPVEHIPYPRDLRFSGIVAFKQRMSQKLRATAKAAKDDPNYSQFFKHFEPLREVKRVNIATSEVGETDKILDELRLLQFKMARLEKSVRTASPVIADTQPVFAHLRLDISRVPVASVPQLVEEALILPGVVRAYVQFDEPGEQSVLRVAFRADLSGNEGRLLRSKLKQLIDRHSEQSAE